MEIISVCILHRFQTSNAAENDIVTSRVQSTAAGTSLLNYFYGLN